MSNSNNQYFISQDTDSDEYELWVVDMQSASLLKKTDNNYLNTIPKGSNIAQVGNYILQWSGINQDNQYSYRLLQFNPDAGNPLGSYVPDKTQNGKFVWSDAAVQSGTWTKSKFFSSRQDFANPDGAKKGFESGSELMLVSMHNFVLNWIPTEGRGTNQLFNFDPGSNDPLPAPYSPQGAWPAIELGQELMYVNGYLLDWKPATGDFVIWQFDPQAEGSLSYPAINRGNWGKLGINSDHQLCVIGSYLLDWESFNNNYRLWEFDQSSENGLRGPVKQGTLPSQITNKTSLTAIETLVPVNIESSATPGTMDFMRDKIEHVIYYMIENRSFDHICGWLYSKNEKFNLIGPDGPYRGVDANFKNIYRGKEYAITQYNSGKLSNDINLDLDQQDPYHDNSDVLRQMFSADINDYYKKKKPDMGGFAWNNGTAEVMQGYSPDQIPVLNGLARNFAISDDWFSSMPSGTTVNRAFALTGSSLGKLNNFQNGAEYAEWSQYPHRPSIWKVMWTNGFRDFKIYNSVEWIECQYTYNLFLKGQIPSIDNPFVIGNYAPQLNQFFDDLKYGTLPKFSFLEPKWVTNTGSTSYHPGNDLIPGERELNDIFTALQDSPLWNKTLLVITFDEHGGLPDHVQPPYAAKPWANDSLEGFTSDIMGVRVPTILVSPFITTNTVFRSDISTPYDSTSILSTLLNWMGIPKSKWGMGERTNQAPTFEAVIRERVPRPGKISLDLPYDKTFPKPNGDSTQVTAIAPKLPIHDLHRLVVPAMIADMTPKLSSSERAIITDELLRNANSLQDLHKGLSGIHQKHS
jgi:phospholipase C